jgi:hypothetical protein
MTKVLTVRMPPALITRADAKAARLGMDRTQYVRHLIQQDLSLDDLKAPGFKSEDLAGAFELGGQPATNERVRSQWQKRLATRHETNR